MAGGLCASCPQPSTVTRLLLLGAACIARSVAGAESGEAKRADTVAGSLLTGLVLAAVVSVVVLVLLIAGCTDCYNSEVSSESHPAAASSAAKWGGAGGYTGVRGGDDAVLGRGFTGEVVIPADAGAGGGGQGLPYALVPSHVPEAQGFCGYAPAGGGGGRGGGAGGYGGGGWGAGGGGGGGGEGWGPGGYGGGGGGGAQNLPGAHVSPVAMPEPEEPPPPYTDLSYR